MKKRWIGLLLAGVMAVTAVSGCSQSTDAIAETKAANRLEEIIARGYIEVVTEPYFAPYEFIDSAKTGSEQYVGSDIEMAKYIAEQLGVELRIVPLEFSAVLSSVTEGKYDLAISALAYTPERAEAMIMSSGYNFQATEGYGLLVREEDAGKYPDVASLKDAVIVVQSGSLQELFVTTQVPEYKELKRVSATTDGFLMVQEGKADVAGAAIGMGSLFAEANTGVAIADRFRFVEDETTQGTRIGIPKGEEELAARIEEIIKTLNASGQYEVWYQEYSEYAKSLGIE